MSIRIEDILTQERTLINAPVSSKKKLLEYIAAYVANLTETSAAEIFERLHSRERLGSTGIGEGIAIPHCRLPECKEPIGLLLKLDEAIEFDAMDHRPVDLVFALVVPEEANNQHLQVLAMLARNFNEPAFRDALRNAPDARQLYERAIHTPQP